MLINSNIHPKLSIYYIGHVVLEVISEHTISDITRLYSAVQEKEPTISTELFYITLDWLYILGTIIDDSNGDIKICY